MTTNLAPSKLSRSRTDCLQPPMLSTRPRSYPGGPPPAAGTSVPAAPTAVQLCDSFRHKPFNGEPVSSSPWGHHPPMVELGLSTGSARSGRRVRHHATSKAAPSYVSAASLLTMSSTLAFPERRVLRGASRSMYWHFVGRYL